MLYYNEMMMARQKYAQVSSVKCRAEIKPVVTIANTTREIAEALATIKAAFAPKASPARRSVRRVLATE